MDKSAFNAGYLTKLAKLEGSIIDPKFLKSYLATFNLKDQLGFDTGINAKTLARSRLANNQSAPSPTQRAKPKLPGSKPSKVPKPRIATAEAKPKKFEKLAAAINGRRRWDVTGYRAPRAHNIYGDPVHLPYTPFVTNPNMRRLQGGAYGQYGSQQNAIQYDDNSSPYTLTPAQRAWMSHIDKQYDQMDNDWDNYGTSDWFGGRQFQNELGFKREMENFDFLSSFSPEERQEILNIPTLASKWDPNAGKWVQDTERAVYGTDPSGNPIRSSYASDARAALLGNYDRQTVNGVMSRGDYPEFYNGRSGYSRDDIVENSAKYTPVGQKAEEYRRYPWLSVGATESNTENALKAPWMRFGPNASFANMASTVNANGGDLGSYMENGDPRYMPTSGAQGDPNSTRKDPTGTPDTNPDNWRPPFAPPGQGGAGATGQAGAGAQAGSYNPWPQADPSWTYRGSLPVSQNRAYGGQEAADQRFNWFNDSGRLNGAHKNDNNQWVRNGNTAMGSLDAWNAAFDDSNQKFVRDAKTGRVSVAAPNAEGAKTMSEIYGGDRDAMKADWYASRGIKWVPKDVHFAAKGNIPAAADYGTGASTPLVTGRTVGDDQTYNKTAGSGGAGASGDWLFRKPADAGQTFHASHNQKIPNSVPNTSEPMRRQDGTLVGKPELDGSDETELLEDKYVF